MRASKMTSERCPETSLGPSRSSEPKMSVQNGSETETSDCSSSLMPMSFMLMAFCVLFQSANAAPPTPPKTSTTAAITAMAIFLPRCERFLYVALSRR